MRYSYEEKFVDFQPVELPVGLFDRIILAIRREKELRKTRRLLFSFFALLIISVVAMPLSWMMFAAQIKSSGVYYFLATAFSDLGSAVSLWKYFSLAILESLPSASLIAFVLSAGVALFTLRLFLRKRGQLIGYMRGGLA